MNPDGPRQADLVREKSASALRRAGVPVAATAQERQTEIESGIESGSEPLRITYTISLLVVAGAVTAYGQPGPAKKPAAPAARSAMGRTPDGHPDLQGNWLSNAATPFERPKELADRTTLTEEEVAELNRRAKRIFAPENFSDAASADGYFMAAWNNIKRFKQQGATDSSERVTELYIDNHTPLITDPPEGKLPVLTKAGQERRAALRPLSFRRKLPARRRGARGTQ